MVSPTKTGWALLGLLGLLYLGALRSETGLMYFVLGILAGCYLLNLHGAWRSARGLRLELPRVITAFEGTRLDEGWILHNPTPRSLGMATVSGPWGEMLRAGLIPPADHLALTPERTLELRGVYPFRSLSLESTYPFGLMRVRKNVSVEGEIVVYPSVHACEAPPAAGHEPMVGGHYTGGKKSRSGTQFSGVRAIQPGDPLRSIHWKSSARGRGTMVKEFEEELSGRVALLLDCAAHRGQGPGTTLDWAARATGSLLFAALDRGHHVEYVDLSGLRPISVPPFSDGTVVLDALARLTPVSRSASREALERAVSAVSGKASLCLILSELNDETAAFLQGPMASRRKVQIYLPAWQSGTPDAPAGVSLQRFTASGLEPRGRQR